MGEDADGSGAMGLHGLPGLLGPEVHGVVPGDRLQVRLATRPHPPQRHGQSVRVLDLVASCVAPGAEAAQASRVIRIPPDADDPAPPHLGLDPAAPEAEIAEGRDLLVRLNAGKPGRLAFEVLLHTDPLKARDQRGATQDLQTGATINRVFLCHRQVPTSSDPRTPPVLFRRATIELLLSASEIKYPLPVLHSMRGRGSALTPPLCARSIIPATTTGGCHAA